MYDILNLIAQFGPVIVFFGTFFEGEVFAIIGGFLAFRGSYSLEFIMALAFCGSFLGDLSVFLFARFFSGHRWVARWKAKPRFAKAIGLVERYQAYFVIVNRYVYGLRMPGLIALGMSAISLTRFIILNLVGAAIWAGIFTTIGYAFGYSIGSVFARLALVEQWVGIALVVIAVALASWFAWRQWGPIIVGRWQDASKLAPPPDDCERPLTPVRTLAHPRRDPGSPER